VLSYHLT